MEKEKSRHTPGPWCVAQGADGATLITALHSRGVDQDVALVYEPEEGGTEEGTARLIAAAPELLDAAAALLAALAKGDPQYSLNAEEGAALNALGAAVLRAEGKGE